MFIVFPGHGWDISIREMAVAVIKLEILSAAPNSEVSMEHVTSEYKLSNPVETRSCLIAYMYQFYNFMKLYKKKTY